MGKAVYEFLVSGLNRAAASQKAQKTRGNLHIQGCTALLQIWACEHLGIGAIRACSDAMGVTGIRGSDSHGVESSPTIQQNQPPPSQNLEQNHPSIQSQLPIQTPIVDLPSSPSKAVKRGKPAKKKAKAAMVDLASSPSKRDNEGEASCSYGGFGEFTIEGAY
uniref:Aminotransferase-like plant mobile domain-containing protein n=1 Tax=Fagus sylvatica TaxID=28930 RepID=A0A2N9GXI5_FAGSY